MANLPIQKTLGDDHLRAIGIVIAEWASLEALMTQAICDLIEGKSRSYETNVAPIMAITGMHAQTKIGLLQTLVRLRFESDADEFDKFAKKLRKAQGKRDIIAHSTWSRGAKPGFIEPKGAKTIGSVKILKGETNAGGIESWAWEFYEHGRELVGFMQTRDLLQQVPFS